MRLFNDTPFLVDTRRHALEPHEIFLSVVVKGTFTLEPGGECKPLSKDKQPKVGPQQNFMDEHGNSRMTDHDLVPFKQRADCLFIGSAHAPGGTPVEGLEVAFGVGALRKRLAVWGDRHWVREAGGGVRLDGPEPFTEKPIRNEYAHGGPTSKYNMHGIGYGRLPGKAGSKLQAASIMAVGEGVAPWDRDEEPAGFGVLAPNMLPRRKQAGTYDAHWQFRRRPLLPRDFDPAHYNCARRDQQVEGFLRGDEEIYLENLHPAQPVVKSRLPGIAVRCFVNRTWPHDGRDVNEFVEVLTNLDTCTVDAAAGLVTLIWRGTLAVMSPKLERLHYVMVVTEPVGTPMPREAYLEAMQAHIAALQPRKPTTELTEEKKQKIAALHRKGIEDIVETLRQSGADEKLIAEVARQPTVDHALKVMSDAIEEIRKTLPPAPGA